MSFRRVLLVIGVLSLLSGLVLSGLAVLRPVSSQPEPVADKPMAIMVAARPIEAGVLLRENDIRWVTAASTGLEADYIQGDEADGLNYIGAVTTRYFSEGEPLLGSALIRPKERDFLAAVLAPGMRAVTVTVNALQSAAGMLLPGDHVDVILTQRFGETGAGLARKVSGETILHNVRVIAVDQRLSMNENSSSSLQLGRQEKLPNTITLEVSQQDAEKLLVATELGNLGLALRPYVSADAASAHERATVWAADVSPALSTLDGSIGRETGSIQQGPARVQVMHGGKTENQ